MSKSITSTAHRRRAALLVAVVAALFSALAQADAVPSVAVVTLGTGGGPLTRLKRAQSANAVVVGEAIYLVDAGDGVLRQLRAAGLNLAAVRAILITHHHLDHVAGLTPLLGLRWMSTIHTPLQLYGPEGLSDVVTGFERSVRPAVAVDFARSPAPLAAVDVKEIRPGLVFDDGNVRVTAAENTHYQASHSTTARDAKSYAYRIETPRGVVVFTGDTGPSDAVTRLAAGADLLVSEVIDLDATLRATERLTPHLDRKQRESLVEHLAKNHLRPEQVGQLAVAAGVKHVVLSHLAPGLDSETSTEPYAAGVRKVFRGPVTIAEDLMSFSL